MSTSWIPMPWSRAATRFTSEAVCCQCRPLIPLQNCKDLQSGETTTFCTAQANFLELAGGNGNPRTLKEPFISFPVGTIHVKSAWRELTADEHDSGRFYTATVRYYEENDQNAEQPRCYREARWGLLALAHRAQDAHGALLHFCNVRASRQSPDGERGAGRK